MRSTMRRWPEPRESSRIRRADHGRHRGARKPAKPRCIGSGPANVSWCWPRCTARLPMLRAALTRSAKGENLLAVFTANCPGRPRQPPQHGNRQPYTSPSCAPSSSTRCGPRGCNCRVHPAGGRAFRRNRPGNSDSDDRGPALIHQHVLFTDPRRTVSAHALSTP